MKGRIALSTGGTGGHVFPAVCLAEELIKRDYHVSWYTDQRGERYFLSVKSKFANSSFNKTIFHIAKNNGFASNLKQCLTILTATFKALKSFIVKRPDMVVGFGGYATAPVVIAATILRIPIILHEQNSVVGKVNRWMAGKAKVLALGFKNTRNLPVGLKTVYVGNPVRSEITALQDQGYPSLTQKLNILVIGGSQGARLFSSIIPAAIALLDPTDQQRIMIVQQARKELLHSTQQSYQDLRVPAIVQPFFNDMAALYKAAQLVICRAGAATVAEICATHRPAIFVPLASSMDNHQYFNAIELSEQKLALLIEQNDFTAEKLATQLREVLATPSILEEMANELQKKYHLNATVTLANYLEDLVPKSK